MCTCPPDPWRPGRVGTGHVVFCELSRTPEPEVETTHRLDFDNGERFVGWPAMDNVSFVPKPAPRPPA